LREGIGERVAEVQAGAMEALAEPSIRFDRVERVFRINRFDLDERKHEELQESLVRGVLLAGYGAQFNHRAG